jgi:nucleolar GTP-binding protein
MNFQYIKKIEGKKVLLDIAFGAGKNASESAADKNRKSEPIIVKRRAEQAKIDCAKKALVRRLDQIVEEFPKIEDLPEFYKELLVNCIDQDKLKSSISSVIWCRDKIASLHKIFNSQLSRAKDSSEITKARKGFYGRVSSLISRIDKDLTFLDSTRKTLKQFPRHKRRVLYYSDSRLS